MVVLSHGSAVKQVSGSQTIIMKDIDSSPRFEETQY